MEDSKNQENPSPEKKTNDESVQQPKGKKVSKKKAPFHAVRERAANIYRNQLVRGVDTMKVAMRKALNMYSSLEYSEDRFLAEYKVWVDRLLDSKRFNDECRGLNLEPFNAATHVVFYGKKSIDNVLEKGLKAIYYDRIPELKDAIFTEKELNSASGVQTSETTSENGNSVSE